MQTSAKLLTIMADRKARGGPFAFAVHLKKNPEEIKWPIRNHVQISPCKWGFLV